LVRWFPVILPSFLIVLQMFLSLLISVVFVIWVFSLLRLV
jgi:hypothetical protein